MNMRRFIYFFFMVMFGFVMNSKADNLYNRTIIANPKVYALMKDAIEDARFNLKNATGEEFNIVQEDSKTEGIHFYLLAQDDPIGKTHLRTDQPDDVWVKSDGSTYLNIYAYYKQGLINGLYTYLDTLGFKWFHPGEVWTVTPHLKDIRITWDKTLRPDFVLRNFFGTFGFPRCAAIDRNEEVTKMWTKWSMRNRLGGSYILRGHGGNEFLKRHMSIFLQHPEYTAEVDGKRTGYQTAAKLCVSNPELQQLFVDDMVDQLKKDMTSHPNSSTYCVTAEPSDGEGECTCESCKKMGSVSDRVFFMANLAAKAFQKIAPNAFVNLYAYNTHAEPPATPIEPNVIVQIIPYGFQNYATAEDMMADWKTKTNNLFIYDYYGLPTTNLDMPLKGSLKAEGLANKIKLWHKMNIKGITLESSYSIGATGIGLYMFARLSWNAALDTKTIIQDYYTHCYGSLAPVMQTVKHTLESDSMDKLMALCKAYSILNEGLKTHNNINEEVKHRADLEMVYLHYLKSLYDLKSSTNIDYSINIADSLMRFVYSTYYTMMIHNFPISEYMRSINTPAIKEYIAHNWDYYKALDPAMKFSNVTQLNEDQTEALFHSDMKSLPNLSTIHTSHTPFVTSVTSKVDMEGRYNRVTCVKHNQFSLHTHNMSVFKFKYVKHHATLSDYTFSLRLTASGKSPAFKTYTTMADTLLGTFQLESNTEYNIDFNSSGAVNLYIPYNADFYYLPSTGDFYYSYLYAYIPSDVSNAIISIGDSKGLTVVDDKGHTVKTSKIYGNMYQVSAKDLPANRIIGLNSQQFNQIKLLNAPNRYALRGDIDVQEK